MLAMVNRASTIAIMTAPATATIKNLIGNDPSLEAGITCAKESG